MCIFGCARLFDYQSRRVPFLRNGSSIHLQGQIKGRRLVCESARCLIFRPGVRPKAAPGICRARDVFLVVSRCSISRLWVVAVGGLVSAAVPRIFSMLLFARIVYAEYSNGASRWFVAGRQNPCARNRKTFSAYLVVTLKWRFGCDVPRLGRRSY